VFFAEGYFVNVGYVG